jgi:hypothetical protein
MPSPRQAVVTVASGGHAEKLDKTFTSFAVNPFLELHAFIIGDRLPERRLPGITYHLEAPDPSYSHPMREIYYRRLLFIDQIEAEFALIVDNHDVLCLQPIPELPRLLRGAPFGAVVEHTGGRYLAGQGYTSCYLNAGVTFWHIASSRKLREAIVARGRSRYRSVEDQLTLNEVVHTRFYDDLIVLPSQYNYRACLAPVKFSNWPTVTHLDGVRIYHNVYSLEAARKLLPLPPLASLPELTADAGPLTPRQQFWRRLRHRFEPHLVK